MNGISVNELLKPYDTYMEGYQAIVSMVEQGKLVPVKSSGSNGMLPPLYQKYRVPRMKKDRSHLLRKLEEEICPPLSTRFYRSHLAQYEKDRDMVLDLQNWLMNREAPIEQVSVNERSFEIFHREKLLNEHGRRLMKNLGLDWELLRVYETCEPVSSYSASRKPGAILIVENLDPFVTIRHLLMSGQETICQMPVSTVVYGGGMRIVSSFHDLLEFGPPEVQASLDQIYYWGDLDWDGLGIYEALCARWPEQNFHLFKNGYLAMLERAGKTDQLPVMKEGQKKKDYASFFSSFSAQQAEQMLSILRDDRYIPQEILSVSDCRKEE